MNPENLFTELKRRNVFRMAGLYLVGAWLLVQVAGTVLPMFGAPDWLPRSIVILLAIGLVPALIFSWIFELTPQGLKRDEDVASEQSIAPQTARRMDRMIIVVLVLALGYFAFDKFVLGPRSEAAASPKTPNENKSIAIPEKSIAVLPFENLSEEKANAYFAEGIQDEILTRLAKIGALKVISRTSTSHYASSPENLPEIAKQLGVANILEGSVQKAKDAVHVNVQLIRAATDDHLWAESYDRKLDDIFGVEAEVAQNIATALSAKLTGAEQAALTEKPTSNSAAYDAYLRGNTQFWQINETSMRQAVQSYEEAVRLDPQFALAWAALARTRSVIFFRVDTTSAGREAAEQALTQAERLQPQAPETQLARCYFEYLVLGEFAQARDHLEQAHRTWPGNVQVLQLLGFARARLGEWQESIAAFNQAIALDPRDLATRRWAVAVRIDMREFAEARRMMGDALAIWPNEPNLLGFKAGTFQAVGQLDEAQAIVAQLHPEMKDYDAVAPIFQQARLRRNSALALPIIEPLARPSKTGIDWLANANCVGDLQTLAGNKEAAQASYSAIRARANELVQERPQNTLALGELARAQAGLGERAAALQTIDKLTALESRDLRNRPGVEDLRARILSRFGEKDEAIAILQRLLETRYEGWFGLPLTPALLRLDPDFDLLRDDPRFQKMAQAQP
jgi:TolB-like protein/cytochrome c-type biogenesis protein CcmH/NrfG